MLTRVLCALFPALLACRYASACESTRNFERGNTELELTLKRTASSNRTIAILLFGATFLLLLLDWLSG